MVRRTGHESIFLLLLGYVSVCMPLCDATLTSLRRYLLSSICYPVSACH